jgi:peptide-N4-(N-acetyl-beta-glucosaminyl)asparagine amidase
MSIGDYIGVLQGKDKCWKAVGPARQAFEELAPKIKLHLDNHIDEVPGSSWVTWSKYMIGSSASSAKPTIMFFCEERQPRVAVWHAIKKSDILQKYPGMRSGHIDSPPEFEYLDQLAMSDNEDDIASSSQSGYMVRIYGRRLVIGTTDNGPGFPRFANVGGTIISGKRKYILSAGHVFIKPRPRSASASHEYDYQIDDEGDDYDDTDIQEDVEITSKYSVTPEDSQSMFDSTSEDGSGASTKENLFHNSPLEDNLLPTIMPEEHIEPDPPFSPKRPHISDATNNSESLAFDFDSSHITGTLAHMSIDLDYALIQVPYSFEFPTFIDDRHLTAQAPTHIIKENPKDVRVIARSSSVGLFAANISGNPIIYPIST